jgi:hypothetical protein
MAKVKEVQVIARSGNIAKFTVPAGTRKEVEVAIADKLRTDTEIVRADDSGGVTVVCISEGNDVWRPRRRFVMGKNGGGEG